MPGKYLRKFPYVVFEVNSDIINLISISLFKFLISSYCTFLNNKKGRLKITNGKELSAIHNLRHFLAVLDI